MPKISKGTHVYRIPNVPTTSSSSAPVPISGQSEAAPPAGTLTFGQLTSVTQDIITAQAGGSGGPRAPASAADPSTIAPSTPSSFLVASNSSAPSSVLTSVSRSGKRGVESDSGGSSRKRTRPLSVNAQAQKDGSDTMKELTGYIKTFLTTSPQASASSSSSQDGALGRAIVLLSEHTNLTLDDTLEIADYFVRDKAQAVIFSNFSETMRAVWLEKTLRKLKSSNM